MAETTRRVRRFLESERIKFKHDPTFWKIQEQNYEIDFPNALAEMSRYFRAKILRVFRQIFRQDQGK